MGCLRLNRNDYRYGFNGMTKDNEIKGTGNSLDFGARIYDSRLGRWLSLDPLQKKYASLSPYNFCGNTPTVFVDKDGRDYSVHVNDKDKTVIIKADWVYLVSYGIEEKRQATEAANYFVSQNGKFQMELENGEIYSIVFECKALNVKESLEKDNVETPNNLIYNVSDADFINILLKYNQVEEQDEIISGVAPNASIYYPNGSNPSNSVIHHEAGHNLGMVHEETGVMIGDASGDEITIDNVSAIIGRANISGQTPVSPWVGGDCTGVTFDPSCNNKSKFKDWIVRKTPPVTPTPCTNQSPEPVQPTGPDNK